MSKDVVKKTAWFIGLWIAGVATVALTGLVIRAFLI